MTLPATAYEFPGLLRIPRNSSGFLGIPMEAKGFLGISMVVSMGILGKHREPLGIQRNTASNEREAQGRETKGFLRKHKENRDCYGTQKIFHGSKDS